MNTTYIFIKSNYCGIHDFLLSLMGHKFNVVMILQSYKDFPCTFKSLATDAEMDDYIGMYLMGGEL